MSQLKHTSGPWIATINKLNQWKSPQIKAGDEVVAYVGEKNHPRLNEHENARLIAAAPDLLEALKTLLADYERGAKSGDWGNWDFEAQPEIKLARAAIAKAEKP